MKQSLKAIALAAAILTAKALPVHAQEAEPPMDMDRMGEILRALDPDTTAFPSGFELTLADVPIMVVADPVADRMRAMIPIRSVAGMSGAELGRVLQANFDTALDARYAVANGRLWAVFIHPLSPLEQDQLISGIGQTVNIALSYGDTYSG
ncbi:MAG: hypothetical protein AAFO58_05870, partial [Pseudomonadota bacterium]